MPNGAVNVTAAEVFDAEEAADVFDAYHQSGYVPGGFTLRAAQVIAQTGPPSTSTHRTDAEVTGSRDARFGRIASRAGPAL